MSIPTFTSSTTAEEVVTAFAQEIKGKNILITGTSINGIGFEAVRTIAKHANLVVITGYNSERHYPPLAELKLSEEAIKKDVPSANIRPLTLDLSSLAAVRIAAAEVNAYPEPLHVLIHNAAAAIGPFKLTTDGLETQLATAHIGPFLLTKLIAPKLLAAREAEYTPGVVFVSSDAHVVGGGVDLRMLERPDAAAYVSVDAYTQAKSAGVSTALEMCKRAKGKINAYSLHPGVIYTNMNQKAESIAYLQAADILDEDGLPSSKRFAWKTIPEGAATTIAAAFDPHLSDKPGSYLVDCAEANAQIAPHSSDPVHTAEQWAVTEKIVGEKFEF
ncbi:NAD-P-binding protein [Mycena epipterygia]|nr:NAD-P-binding protein [Mycena epipterygia]